MSDTRLTAAELLRMPTMKTSQPLIDGARVHWIERETASQPQPVSGQETRQSDE